MTARVAAVCGTPIERAADDQRARTIMVSDLHIAPHGGEVLAAFLELLATARAAAATTRLLVLGDLLESLVNDRQLALGAWPDLIAGLRATTAAGVPVTVLHGNRDFMLGRRFAAATGCNVVAGGVALRLGGKAVLALHGDELCRNDLPYQRAKRWLRSAPVRALCRLMPLAVAARVGRRARASSGLSMARGDATRFAPVAEAVAEVFAAGYGSLVFGHVHTPARGSTAGGDYLILPAFDATRVFVVQEGTAAPQFRRLGSDLPIDYGPLTFAPSRR